MAKNPTAAATPALAFKIDTGVALPPIQRLQGAQASPYSVAMKAMALGKDDKALQSFFIPADVPATITDPAEREKAAKDEARKISNRVSGIARRLSEEKDASGKQYAFAIRSRQEDGKIGVRVYRVAPPTPAPTPAPAA